jgi:hypothetical protein
MGCFEANTVPQLCFRYASVMLPIYGLRKWSKFKLRCVESISWPWATTALKRLASAVQLRPAAPSFQSFSITHSPLLRFGYELLVDIEGCARPAAGAADAAGTPRRSALSATTSDSDAAARSTRFHRRRQWFGAVFGLFVKLRPALPLPPLDGRLVALQGPPFPGKASRQLQQILAGTLATVLI